MQVDYDKYKIQDFYCSKCGWKGKGSELFDGSFSEEHLIGDLECPKCFHLVAFWQAPLKKPQFKMEKNENLPRWLERAKDQIKNGELKYFTKDMLNISIEDVLKDSCFYLSAGADITPIVAFKDIIYSYILCDLSLYNSIEGIDNKFNGILVKVKDRLIKQGFFEIQKFNLGKDFLGLEDKNKHYSGYVLKMINCEISFWSRENKIYSVMYINYDNTYIYKELFIKNYIIPKAICEYKPDGGALVSNIEDVVNPGKLTVEEKNNIMPDFYLGHKFLDSIGNADQYELITDTVKYFGDYGGEGLYLFKKMN